MSVKSKHFTFGKRPDRFWSKTIDDDNDNTFYKNQLVKQLQETTNSFGGIPQDTLSLGTENIDSMV